jgi:hypothetical protein
MATLERSDAMRAAPSTRPHQDHLDEADDPLALGEFEEELKRLSAVNQELLDEFQPQDDPQARAAIIAAVGLAPADAEQIELLRLENAELKARIQELEALRSGKGEELWLERQREYEILLEEKSEVIRGLHQKLQESQESAIGSPPPVTAGASSTRVGQAEEILRLKRELEEQRRQLEQDEEDMMAQMRQMEMTMAKERANMARQRQEVERLQSDLAREIEQSSRDPELRERLNNLRRSQEPRPKSSGMETPPVKPQQKSSGLFRRIFG